MQTTFHCQGRGLPNSLFGQEEYVTHPTKMPRFVQFVMGPAGTGKSTYCKTIQEHCQTTKRSMRVINLDPAAEEFLYEASLDIKELISVEDVMEQLGFGPNGSLVYCMEYLLQVKLDINFSECLRTIRVF